MCKHKDGVWCLEIVHGVDDYKHRGECATSTVRLFSSRKKCMKAFKQYLIEQANDRLKYVDLDSVDESIKKYIKETEDGPIFREEDIPKPFPFSKFYSWVSEAEFIPAKWTYTIECKEIEGGDSDNEEKEEEEDGEEEEEDGEEEDEEDGEEEEEEEEDEKNKDYCF